MMQYTPNENDLTGGGAVAMDLISTDAASILSSAASDYGSQSSVRGGGEGVPPQAFLTWMNVSVTVSSTAAHNSLSQYSRQHNCFYGRRRRRTSASASSSCSRRGGVPGVRFVLENVSGYAQPGAVLAIMGPSGCGKTTLLSTLGGRSSSSTRLSNGEILTNGRKQRLSYGNSAYVTQEDVFMATLTVYETLMYAAQLQLGGGKKPMSQGEKRARVEEAIRELGLKECANTRVGASISYSTSNRGISGGEKRRLSIAVETLRRPQLMFVDEPTSGLDSAAAFHVMRRLQRIAKDGSRRRRTTVVISIHQPSAEVFALFDHLCLLSNGRTIYFGEATKAQQFFDIAGFPCPPYRNPSDHFLSLINPEFEQVPDLNDDIENVEENVTDVTHKIELLTKSYFESNIRKEVSKKTQEYAKKEGELLLNGNGIAISAHKQAYWLTSRSFKNMCRNWNYYWFRLFVYIILSFVVGTIYYDIGKSYRSIQARGIMLTFVTCYLAFLGVLSFPSTIEDMKICKRERLNGLYSAGAFVVANTLSSFPFMVLLSLFPTVIIYPLVGLHAGFLHPLFFFVILLAFLLTVEALLMAVSSLVPDFLTGMMAGGGVMAIYIITAGFYRSFSDLPRPIWRYPFSYISFFTWTNKALFNNEFSGLQFENIAPTEPPLAGDKILEKILQMELSYSKWWMLVILVCMTTFYRLLLFIAIKVRERLPTYIHIHLQKATFSRVKDASISLHGGN